MHSFFSIETWGITIKLASNLLLLITCNNPLKRQLTTVICNVFGGCLYNCITVLNNRTRKSKTKQQKNKTIAGIALYELFRCDCITRKIYFAYLEHALFILAEVRLAKIELADYCLTPAPRGVACRRPRGKKALAPPKPLVGEGGTGGHRHRGQAKCCDTSLIVYIN